MKSLMVRIIHQFKNDKRTLGLLIIAPLLVLTLVYFVTGESSYQPKIATMNMPSEFNVSLQTMVTIIKLDEKTDIDAFLKAKTADAIIYQTEEGLVLKMLESSSKTGMVSNAVKKVMEMNNPNKLKLDFIYGKANISQFNTLGYVFLGFISFFFVFIISGMSLVRERTSQTVERLLMTPIKRSSVIAGYTLGFSVFAVLQSIVIFLYATYVLGLEVGGSILLCMLVMLLLSITAVSLGALVSIFANSELQIAQFMPIVVLPQVFFSGIIPIETIPYGLGDLAYIMPIYYGCMALKMIMIESANLVTLFPWLGALLVYIAILFIINTRLLKKYREI